MAVAAAVELMAPLFRIEPVVADDTVWPEFRHAPECGGALLSQEKAVLNTSIEEGRRAFFEEMDTELASMTLGPVLDRHLAMPCITVSDRSLKTEFCKSGVFYSRLLLLLGRPEAASAHVAALADRCSSSDLMAEDVPPDVQAFVQKVLMERGARVLAARNSLDIVCLGDCLEVFVDGRLLDATSAGGEHFQALSPALTGRKTSYKSVPALPGRHSIEVRVADARWMTASLDYEGGHRALLLDPSSEARLVAKHGLLVDSQMDGVAREIVETSDVVVLGVVPVSDGSKKCQITVVRDPAGKMTGHVLAVLGPDGSSVRFTTVKGSPLVFATRHSWPWPWVTGSLAAAFLGAGVALNVYAQKAWDDAEQGSITRDRGDALNAGAIAGYSLAGAGVLTTVLLAVLKPSREQSVLVEPTASGFRLKF